MLDIHLHHCWCYLWCHYDGGHQYLQPTDWAVPMTSLMAPKSSLATDHHHICWAVIIISTVLFPLCWCYSDSFLSLGGSLKALMFRTKAEVTISIWAWLFWMVRLSVILRPAQWPVALAMSPPNCFWTDFGGQGNCGTDFPTEAPQVHNTDLVEVELEQYVKGSQYQMNLNTTRPKRVAIWPPLKQKLKTAICYYRFVCIF